MGRGRQEEAARCGERSYPVAERGEQAADLAEGWAGGISAVRPSDGRTVLNGSGGCAAAYTALPGPPVTHPCNRGFAVYFHTYIHQRGKIRDHSDPQNCKYRFCLKAFLRPQITFIHDRFHFSAKILGSEMYLMPLRLRYDGFAIVPKLRRKALIQVQSIKVIGVQIKGGVFPIDTLKDAALKLKIAAAVTLAV